MHMIRKIVLAALCVAAAAGHAQSITHQFVASQFNNWHALPQSGPYSNTNLVAGANVVSVNPCSYAAGGAPNIPVFVASTPIKVVDPGNAAVDEIITPTSITNGGCTATLTTSNAHTSPYFFQSGTYGLQEALNASVLSNQINTVLLDTNWFQAGGTSTIIYSAAGNANTDISAVNFAPEVAYGWNGTHYVSSYSILGTAVPTIAAGAAAGTSPTVSNASGSNGNVMVANVTTGTATTTGTLFTETVTAPALSRAVNCTLPQSIGANAFTGAITFSSSGGVATFAVAAAPTASTAYVFSVTCN
jgi:hypothetical protein